jgi:hypothetical protein
MGKRGRDEETVRRPISVIVLAVAKKEGRDFLTETQYVHITNIIKLPANFDDPAAMSALRIEPIADFFELKEKGGILGKTNVRIYFGFDPNTRQVVVAKAYKKEVEGQTPRHVVINVQARLRAYRAGQLMRGTTVYRGSQP